jgi:hypothetical protein
LRGGQNISQYEGKARRPVQKLRRAGRNKWYVFFVSPLLANFFLPQPHRVLFLVDHPKSKCGPARQAPLRERCSPKSTKCRHGGGEVVWLGYGGVRVCFCVRVCVCGCVCVCLFVSVCVSAQKGCTLPASAPPNIFGLVGFDLGGLRLRVFSTRPHGWHNKLFDWLECSGYGSTGAGRLSRRVLGGLPPRPPLCVVCFLLPSSSSFTVFVVVHRFADATCAARQVVNTKKGRCVSVCLCDCVFVCV